MNKEQRIEYLTKLISKNNKPYASKEIWYKKINNKFSVYQIDLQFLIYNAYNSRIGSRVKSLRETEPVIF